MEIEILGRQFPPDVLRRAVLEGYEAYQLRGPNRQCPYGSDQRNGAYSFGANHCRKGFSREQTIELFNRQENY